MEEDDDYDPHDDMDMEDDEEPSDDFELLDDEAEYLKQRLDGFDAISEEGARINGDNELYLHTGGALCQDIDRLQD